MKKIFNFIRFLPSVFVRLAHIFEHMFCDDVPSITYDPYEEEE